MEENKTKRNSGPRLCLWPGFEGGGLRDSFVAHLYHASARVEEDAPFGLFGDLLVSVEVHDVGVVRQLGELEIPPLEWLHRRRDVKKH